MSSEELERQVELMLQQGAKFKEAIAQAKEAVARLTRLREKTSGETQQLNEAGAKSTIDVQLLAAKVSALTERITQSEARDEIERQKMREALDKLTLANKATRELSEEIVRLIAATSQPPPQCQ